MSFRAGARLNFCSLCLTMLDAFLYSRHKAKQLQWEVSTLRREQTVLSPFTPHASRFNLLGVIMFHWKFTSSMFFLPCLLTAARRRVD